MNRVIAGIGAFLLSYAAAAASNTVPAYPLPGADRNDCFPIRFAKDRRVLDNKRLLVWTSGSSPYLVELDRPLQGLDTGGQSITLIDGDGDGLVCRSLRDSIFVRDAILSKQRKVVGVTSLEENQIRILEQKYERSLAREKRGAWD